MAQPDFAGHNYKFPIISPSMLSSDFTRLEAEIDMINKSEADWFHLDVMDGRFVPNITFGMPIIAAMKKHAKKPFDVHLMIVEPERYLGDFANAGADHQARRQRIGRGIATDGHMTASPFGLFADPRDNAQDGGMGGVLQGVEIAIATLGGQNVLGQIVGADTEEIGQRGEAPGHDRRRRNLDHHAEFDRPLMRHAGLCQIMMRRFGERARLTHILGRGDHGKHDPHIPADTRP